MGFFLYFGFSAQLSLEAKVSHWVLSGLFTTRKSLLFLSIFTKSPISSGEEIWPSTETVVPSLTLTPKTSTLLSEFITTGLKLRECGQIGVITIACILAASMGPAADRLYAVEPVGVATIRPSLTNPSMAD